jgi:hypothetical protein
MNIKEKLNYYTEKLNIPFFIKSFIKLELLDNELRRYIKKDPDYKSNLIFTSQDLRSYIIALEKVHKALNKRLSFLEFEKRLKKYKEVTNENFCAEIISDKEYIIALNYCQSLLIRANYWAVTTYLIERKHECNKERSDEIFNHEILSGLLEIF